MVENKVQQEILYREALAMGLDKNDEIVKRRMAQKMQFLAEDVAAAREPTTAELRSWFEKNSAKFAQPPRLSFRHLYFSPDRRGARARDDAAQALAKLAGQPVDAKIAGSLADAFMFQDYYRDRAPDYLGKEFGPPFALALAKLPPGSWQGPVESGFGWHLVFVDTMIPGRVPAFEEIEPDVRTAWLGEQKALAWEKAYKKMRANYTVLLPAPPESSAASSSSQTEGPRRRARPRSDRRATHRRIPRRPARVCSPDRRRPSPTRPGPPTSSSRKPRPASSACCGARRCSRACACRSRSSCPTACGTSRSPASRSCPIRWSSGADRRRADRPRGQAHRVPRAAVHDHRRAGAHRTARRHALDRARPPAASVDRVRGAARRAGLCRRVPRAGHRAHPARRRPPPVRARRCSPSCARRGCW